jgi:hypothetical protein
LENWRIGELENWRIGRLEPDYSNYSIQELEDALASIDKDAYPGRTKILEKELSIRQGWSGQRQTEVSFPYYWTSTGRNLFFVIFFSGLAFLSYSSFSDKSLEGVITFIISTACLIFYGTALYQKSGWVHVDDNGISYQNIWGNKQVPWSDISGCYIRYIRFTKIVYIVGKNGGEKMLPIVGWKAQEINNIVNTEIQRREA